MKLAELQQALQTTSRHAVLVSPRVLERVIEQVHNLPALLWRVPHRKSCVVDRRVLFRHIEQEDLDLNPGQLLPDTVILLAQPTTDFLAEDRATILGEYWRLLFHAMVHFELEQRRTTRDLTPDETRARIAAIGRDEFDEARTVLWQEGYLTEDADETAIYIEFAAVFLELFHFARNLLPVYFPAIADLPAVRAVLAQDIDSDRVFLASRLPGAVDPKPVTDKRSDESHDFYYKLVRSAERAEELKNTVRAGILRTRAARVAPGDLTLSAREEAAAAMRRLTSRLEAALELSPADGAEWAKHLIELLDRADQGHRPSEADLLFVLQKACDDHERDVYALNLIDWLVSGFKRPIKRPLPSQRLVRISQHLQSARDRLTRARLSDAARRHFDLLLDAARQKTEQRLRVKLRPVLQTALEDVGLLPENPPEAVAFQKIIEELLDRIIAHGFLTFGDLRDTLSRNQLKLPDLGDPRSFVSGDPLLRLDRRLGALLDGVYRPAEFYMRGLEQFTALNFGTRLGRWVTRFVTVPFGGAFVLIEAFNVIMHAISHELPQINLLGSLRRLVQVVFPAAAPSPGSDAAPGDLADSFSSTVSLPYAVSVGSFYFILGLFLLALLRSPELRERWRMRLQALGRGLWWLGVVLPGRIVRRETLEAVARSWPFQFFYWCLFSPLLVCIGLRLVSPWFFSTITHGMFTFLAAAALVNSTFGKQVGDAAVQVGLQFWELLRAGLIPGLVRIVLRLFEQMVEALEYLLFTVDEQLRYRSGDSQFLLGVRTVLAALWFPISYLLRFYTVVLIEPMLNPIKLPLTIVAAKFVYPLLAAQGWLQLSDMSSPLVEPLRPFLGYWTAWILVVGTLYLLPDAFVFLIWETKENWRLYRANRPGNLEPVIIGSHGETLRALLAPGFHSGTVPKLYSRLRRAERQASRSGNWQHARYYRSQLDHVAEAVQLFVARNMLALVCRSPAWHDRQLRVGVVEVASRRFRLELHEERWGDRPVGIEIGLHAGWIVAGLVRRGWLDSLSETERRPLDTALAGLYKLAGVDLVREQLERELPHGTFGYDLDQRDLIVWTDERRERAIRYDLKRRESALEPRPDGTPAEAWPTLEARRLIFGRVPIPWHEWTATWQRDQSSNEHPPLKIAGSEWMLIPRSAGGPLAAAADESVESNGRPPANLLPAVPREGGFLASDGSVASPS